MRPDESEQNMTKHSQILDFSLVSQSRLQGHVPANTSLSTDGRDPMSVHRPQQPMIHPKSPIVPHRPSSPITHIISLCSSNAMCSTPEQTTLIHAEMRIHQLRLPPRALDPFEIKFNTLPYM